MKGYRVKSSTLHELDNTSFIITVLAIVIVIVIAISIIMPNIGDKSSDEAIKNRASVSEKIVDDRSYDKEASDSDGEAESATDGIKAPSTASGYYKVIGVVDGDTVDVNIDGRSVRVRLIGVNAPETVHPSKPVECFGKEASNYTKRMLNGKSVQLELDSSQDTFDAYNRLLAYVYINGDNFNYMLIRNGYAYEYTYNIPYKYQTEFKSAQRYASSNNIGLWNPKVCSN